MAILMIVTAYALLVVGWATFIAIVKWKYENKWYFDENGEKHRNRRRS